MIYGGDDPLARRGADRFVFFTKGYKPALNSCTWSMTHEGAPDMAKVSFSSALRALLICKLTSLSDIRLSMVKAGTSVGCSDSWVEVGGEEVVGGVCLPNKDANEELKREEAP